MSNKDLIIAQWIFLLFGWVFIFFHAPGIAVICLAGSFFWAGAYFIRRLK